MHAARMRRYLDQYFGYWRQLPATYPIIGYPSQQPLQNNGFCSATPQSDFFGNTQAYPYLSDSERRRIALEQGIITNIPITSAEDHDTLPEMIRIPISDLDVPDIDVCEDPAESSLIHVNYTVNDTVDNTVDKLLSPKVVQEDLDNLPHIDVCFASVAAIESQPLLEVVEVLEVVGAITAQPHKSVHRTKDLEQALKKVSVPTMKQKSGPGNEKNTLVHTADPKRSRTNKAQPPLCRQRWVIKRLQ
ncbi:hypothetical protein BASA61_000794 [Batrachochytrium salamandrivorans]|nr:hypothetical protein BASA61_000794 [Batrachochytrium salamandrivorans]